MSQSPSYASPTPSPSLQSSKLTISLNAARRNNAPAESTPSPLRTPPVLTPTARKQALREFYNLDRSRPISTNTDLDRDPFNGKDFVDKLARENGLHALVRMENDLVQEIRNLDGERKSLVYDNYNKLIAATETIRKVPSFPVWVGFRNGLTVDESAFGSCGS
jgi:vacuolar protein sorting-associated protein 51